MGLDLSGVDAELSALLAEPVDLDAIAAEEARALGALDDVDAALSALEVGVAIPSSPVRVAPSRVSVPRVEAQPRASAPRVDAMRPKSGEIALGAPVQRRAPEPMSSELTLLDSDRPKSGSFELPELDLDDSPVEVDAFASPKRKPDVEVAPLSLNPDDDGAPAEITPLAVDPFEDEDEDEADQPLSLFQDPQPDEDPVVSLEDRDPDAEFDALFDEATHPSGIPTRNLDLDDENLSADDLLSGLAAPDENESDAATSALFSELGPGDRTELVAASELQAHLDPFPSDEELGSSEFEIVLDEEGAAKDIVPSQAEASGPNSPDKRPSFLGRLFGRKDDKP